MLSDKIIQAAKPRINDKTGNAEPYRIYDNKVEHLCIQVSQNKKTQEIYKTFQLAYKVKIADGSERRRFKKLERYSREFMLKEARESAKKLISEYLSKGLDPKEEIEKRRLEASREAERKKKIGTVGDLFNFYINHLKQEGKKSWGQVQRAFKVDVKPKLDYRRKAQDIEPDDIAKILRVIVKRGSYRYADQVRGYLHAAFQLGLSLDYDLHNEGGVKFGIRYNPVASIPKAQKTRPVGQRYLNKEEVTQVWQMLPLSGLHYNTVLALQLLIATGQRVQEVTEAKWNEIDLENGFWEISGERTKNGNPHYLPLSDIAITLFEKAKLLSGTYALIFPSDKDPKTPITWKGLNRAVTRFCEKSDIEHFTPRDLRRTWKTLAGEAGLSKEIRDRLQNHNIQGVSAKHYDRYSYLREKEIAIKTWEAFLYNVIKDKKPESNIITLNRNKKA